MVNNALWNNIGSSDFTFNNFAKINKIWTQFNPFELAGQLQDGRFPITTL